METFRLTLTPRPRPSGANFHWRGGAEPQSPYYLVKAAELGISVFIESTGDGGGDPLVLLLVAPDEASAVDYARWLEAYLFARGVLQTVDVEFVAI
jgi:hypothetical protein